MASGQTVFSAAVDAVNENFTLKGADAPNGVLSFTSGVSAFTWGERFSLQVVEVAPSRSEVHLTGSGKSSTVWAGQSKLQQLADRLLIDIGQRVTAASSIGERPATPTVEGAAAPGWIPDPTGRHELRYFDGDEWTGHVTDGGVPALDPMN